MDLERVAVVLRERDAWEATDLGFAMARRFARPLFAVWAAVVLPLALALHLVLFEFPTVALLALWWLKPLFDRFALAVLSRSFFGEAPRATDILLHPRRYLGRGLLGALTLRRLSPRRSFVLPVEQLEGLGAAERRERIRVLSRDDAGAAYVLTGVVATFEGFLFASSFALVALFIQNEDAFATVFGMVWGEQAPAWAAHLVSGFYLLAMSLVEPFYVGAGFALYVNRRVHLEGWDLELGFRRLASRLEQGAARALSVTLLAGLLLGAPAALAATPAEAAAPRAAEVRAAVEEVLADPAFATTRTERTLVPIGADEEEPEPSQGSGGAWLAGFASLLATLLKWLVIAALLAALTYVLAQLVRRVSASRGAATAARPQTPDVLFGLDIRPESLPADLLAAARAHWLAGDATAALSLLYRGALAYLVRGRALAIPASATEGECVTLVARAGEARLTEDFDRLTRAWQQLAYARRPVTAGSFEELCQRWSAHLGGAA